MLRIIEGGFESDAHERIKNEIYTLTEMKKRAYLLVPEQQTLTSEAEMADFLPESAPLTFEVTNFTRLANSVFRALGGVAGEYSDKAKDALIMWRTLSELSPFLSMTGNNSEINAGLVSKALSACDQMRALGLTPEELSTLSEDDSIKHKGRLVSKLLDASKIMTTYKKLHSEHFTDVKDDVQALAEKLSEHPDFFADAQIFIEGFTSFTEPQYKVISALMKILPLSVHLTLKRHSEECFEFLEVRKTKERLLRLADLAGCEKKLVRYNDPRESASEEIASVGNLLWRSFGEIDNEYLHFSDAIKIYEASDPYEACDFIGADIKKRIMLGASSRDFAVVAGDITKYLGIIDTALENASLSYFISKKKDVMSFEAIKLIFAAASAIDSSFDRAEVMAYAKCGLCKVSPEERDEFELYIETWQINGSRFTDSIPWNMNPSGYSTRPDEEGAEILLRIDKTRNTIILPLIKYKENRSAAKTVREHAVALMDFLSDIGLEEAIYERADELYALGEVDIAEEHEKLWGVICGSLDTLVGTLGDFKIDSRGFENQLKIVLSTIDVGRIPAFYDEITVGSADMIRLSGKKHIYLLGVNHGEFPASPKDNSYFTDSEKLLLSKLNVEIAPQSEENYARELFSFSRAFMAAQSSVSLVYSTRDEGFAPTAAADVIKRIGEITGGEVKPRRISEIPPLEKIYFPTAALSLLKDDESEEIRDALLAAGYSREVAIADKDIKNSSLKLQADTASLMYRGDLALTQSRIDKYIGCPLSYYLRYDLNLSEGTSAKFDARNIGTFIHAIVENFFGELLSKKESVKDLSEERKKELLLRAAKKYLDEVCEGDASTSKRLGILLGRLTAASMPVIDGLCDEFKNCAFLPRYFELKISRDDPSLPSPAEFSTPDGKRAFVYGSIDRVDTFKEGKDVYVRVIDYKTGTKTFTPEDLDEGRNLQMFLYLKSIVETTNEGFLRDIGLDEGGRLIPAGVIYVKAELGDVTIPKDDPESEAKEIAKLQARRGMILDDKTSIGAMNSSYMPVRFTKKGEPYKGSEKYLYDEATWGSLMDKISERISSLSCEMKSGNISTTDPAAKNSPCGYCKFKPICRSAKI